MKNTSSNSRQILKIYWQHTKPFKKRLYIIYSLMAIAQVVEDFLQPLIVSFILTNLAAGDLLKLQNQNLPLIIGGVIATEMIGHLLWNRIIIPMVWRTQEEIMRNLNMTAFDHLQKMSSNFFGNRFAGSLVSQVNKFIGSYERFTDALTWNIYKLLIATIATTVILLPKAPAVSIAIIILGIIYIPLVWQFRKKQVPYNQAWSKAETSRTGQLADAITNIMAVKSFTGESIEYQRMLKRTTAVYDRSIDTMKMTMRHELGIGGVQRSINVAVIIISLALAINGLASVGLIYLALTFTISIMRRLWDLNNTFRAITRVFGDAYDMAEILQIQPSVKDPKNPAKSQISSGRITIKDLVFKHEAEDLPLFDKLSLDIKPGEKIGLVGLSGSGKTTITKLIMRFMDPQGGSIKVDNQNIADITQQDLRSSIAYVPQEPMLFHRSLADNIAYGRPGASKKEIEAIAKLSHAHDFIKDLPEGYNTLVGERGVKLSGGQRQRVAIARAMIKNAPILILDEATSALDSESEALIQDALWTLMDNKTAIVVAHRLSTIQKMDRIVVLNNGKIIEQGSHRELIFSKGKYAELWNRQSGGFMEE